MATIPPPRPPAARPGTAPPEPALTDAAILEAFGALDAELTTLQPRLLALERALGIHAPPGHTPPPLPEIARRLAALERRAGVVPGLDPLPGLGAAVAVTVGTTPGAAVPTSGPTSRPGAAARRAGVLPALCVAAALLALLLWPDGTRRPGDSVQTPPVAQVNHGNRIGSREWQVFMERNQMLPDAGAGTADVTPPRLDWATIRFLEANQLPDLATPTPGVCRPGEIAACDP